MIDSASSLLRRRWWIVSLLSASIAINLVDRQVLSVVAPILRDRFSLSDTQYSYIIFAFQLGMLLGQVPAGLFLDAMGARLGFIFIFLSWSVINALHGLARGVAAFVGLRFLLGVSECGDYSGGIKVIAGLFPSRERALAGGLFNGGAQLGSVLAPPIVVFIALHWGWRSAFLLPSSLGLIWLIPWLSLFPREKFALAAAKPDGVTESPPRHVAPVGKLIRNRQVLGLMLFRAMTGPLTSFYWYWLPEYLRHGRGMTMISIGLLVWIPYVAGGLGNVVGGYFSDVLINRGVGQDGSRKTAFIVGGIFSTLSLSIPEIGSVPLALATICAIVFGNQFMVGPYIAMVGDIFPSGVVGTVNGLGGFADSGMGMITMLLTGIVIDRFSYFPVFIAAGIFPTLAVLSVFLVVRKIAPAELSFLRKAGQPHCDSAKI
jgi:MFS transporter, ACS family, hexuronate transporter